MLYIPSFKHIQSPILNMPGMVVLQQLNTERDGVALESISDKIDKINVLKDQARKQMNRLAAESDNAYKESKSDSEKDGQGGRAR